LVNGGWKKSGIVIREWRMEKRKWEIVHGSWEMEYMGGFETLPYPGVRVSPIHSSMLYLFLIQTGYNERAF
jgi:hypothetical protein